LFLLGGAIHYSSYKRALCFSNTPIAIIGGAGKSGKFVVQQLIQQNIPFRILLRRPASYDLAIGQVVQGDVRDIEAVRHVCQGCTVIISTLGQTKGEPPVFSHATRNILAVMKTLNINRYILTTGLNVDTTLDKKGPVTLAGTNWMKQHYPETTADKQLEYELLAASEADWTLVRLPLIGLTETTAPIAISLEDCPGTGIHGIDLARFLIFQTEDRNFVKQAPFLANNYS
jgi:putative NADH-flavin reductase